MLGALHLPIAMAGTRRGGGKGLWHPLVVFQAHFTFNYIYNTCRVSFGIDLVIERSSIIEGDPRRNPETFNARIEWS
jgi:hypothetical protein